MVRVAAVLVCLQFSGKLIAEAPSRRPDFATIVLAVRSYFEAVPAYQSGDLISRSQIEKALASVEDAGWKVPEADAVGQLGLADNSFLVRELWTPAGRKLMRKIGRQPGMYARLDRLSSISRGQSIVRDLIRHKNGDAFVKYLATTKGGHTLGRQLAATPRGVDLNKPTGRIYTDADLIDELKRIHEQSAR